MRPGSVVLLHPRIQRRLECGQVLKRASVIQQLAAHALMETLHLARRRRRARLRQPMHDGVVPADPIEQHLTAMAEPRGELLAVVRQHLTRHPKRPQRLGEGQADSPAGGPHHRFGDHTEAGMVVDAGHHLNLTPVGQEHAADDVQLP